MHHLDHVKEEKAAKEVADRNSEPALNVREEDDGLVGPLSGNSLPTVGLQPTSVLGLSNP
jgi:hypothetical protein